MSKVFRWIILGFGVVIFGYPFVWMIVGSFKPELEITNLKLWSSLMSWNSYHQVFTKIPIARAFCNSVLVSFSVTASVVVLGSMVGYALAKLKFVGKGLLYLLILFTMMIPFQITLIPQYVLMVKLGWTDTYLSLIVPSMLSGLSIILFRLIWPLSTPVIITVAILTFMASWNDVLWPLIVIRDRSLMTMPQLVTIFVTGGEAESQLGALLAAATLLALPVILAYAFFQRYFIQSMASSGIKG